MNEGEATANRNQAGKQDALENEIYELKAKLVQLSEECARYEIANEQLVEEKNKAIRENLLLRKQFEQVTGKVTTFQSVLVNLKCSMQEVTNFALEGNKQNFTYLKTQVDAINRSIASLKENIDVENKISRHLLGRGKSKKTLVKSLLKNVEARPTHSSDSVRNRVAYWKHENTLAFLCFGESKSIDLFYLLMGDLKHLLFCMFSYQIGYVLTILLMFELVPGWVGILGGLYTFFLTLFAYFITIDWKLAKIQILTAKTLVNFALVLVGSVSLSACFHYDARSVIIVVAVGLAAAISIIDAMPYFYFPNIRIPIFSGLTVNYLALLLCINLYVFPNMDNVQFNFGTINGVSKVPIQISLVQLSSTAFSILFLFSLDYVWFAIKHHQSTKRGIPVLYGITVNCYGADDFELIDKLQHWPNFKNGILKPSNREVFQITAQYEKLDLMDEMLLIRQAQKEEKPTNDAHRVVEEKNENDAVENV